MKRFFLSALLVLGALTAATAGDFGLPISLTKRPHKPVLGISDPRPGIDPLSVTEDDDFFVLSAEQADDAEFFCDNNEDIVINTDNSFYMQNRFCIRKNGDNYHYPANRVHMSNIRLQRNYTRNTNVIFNYSR